MVGSRGSLVVVAVLAATIIGLGCSSDSDDKSEGGGGTSGAADGGAAGKADGGAAGEADGSAGKGGGETVTGTVTLNVTDIDDAFAGKSAYAMLLPGTKDCLTDTSVDAPTGGGIISDGSCKIVIKSIESGDYTLCTFIDDDGNFQPSEGDLAGMLPLTVSGDTEETVSASDWIGL